MELHFASRERSLLLPSEAERIELREADATLPGALPPSTTFAYLSNLCFSEALNRRMATAVLRLPKLRCLGALRELPSQLDGAEATSEETPVVSPCRLRLMRTMLVRMSWDDTTRLHIFCCKRA